MKTHRAVLLSLGLVLVLLAVSPAKASPISKGADIGRNRATLTVPVREVVQEDVEIEGTLQVLFEDRAEGSRLLTFLETDSGERYALSFASDAPQLPTGERVRIRGTKTEDAIAVESGSRGLERVSAVRTASLEAAAALPNTFGAQRTVVLLINFSNNTVQPYSTSFAKGVVMTSVSNFMLENSYQQTWLTGDVFGWYTIPLTNGCDYATLATQAQAAATVAGVNLANYDHYIYAFPESYCGWSGLGTVGGSPSSAWINAGMNLQNVSHEMGHNLGLFHSHSLDCGTVVLGATCTTGEYGDSLDTMGSASDHYNAFQKERLGWLNLGSSPAVTEVTANGTYAIAPYETVGSASKALKIPQGTTGSYFYVELRRAVGVDSSLGSNSNVESGVVIHLVSPADANSSRLLDMTPETSSWSDPALTVGKSFTDPVSGATITVNSAGGTGASVTVALPGAPPPVCSHLAPAVSLSPAQTLGKAAGTPVTFTLSVTNNDGGACAAAVFAATSNVPSGWTATAFSPLSVSPGATSSTSLQVTSAAAASNGSYAVSVQATNQADPTATAAISAAYLVNNPVGSVAGTFADNFNRPDSSSIGGAWSEIAGNLVILSGELRNDRVAGNSIAVLPASSGATQSASADFASVDNGSAPRLGVVLRYRDPLNYYLVYRMAGPSRLVISRIVNGAETILASASVPNPSKNVLFHLTGRVLGTALTVELDGAVRATAADATFSAGTAGILLGSKTNKAQHRADNFSVSFQ